MYSYESFRDDPEKLKKFSISDCIPMVCDSCGKHYEQTKASVLASYKRRHRNMCSVQCQRRESNLREQVKCKQCDKQFEKRKAQIKKSPNHFCSRSCAVRYNNANKQFGVRRSKLEVYMERELTRLYPDEEIVFNGKEAIKSELDIFFPRLKLAFELNGIFHYEPIYGQEKLDQTQANDQNKFQACQAKGISLCVIDTSSQKHFKERTSRRYLDIVINIVEKHISLISGRGGRTLGYGL